jgi:hypothetical protein
MTEPSEIVDGRGGGHRWEGHAYSDDEGAWRCGCGAYCDHQRPCGRHGSCDGSYVVKLTAYERDNLLHALYAASGHGRIRSPLYVLNNGDWLMQVLNKIGLRGDNQMHWGQPNATHDALAERANHMKPDV